MRFAKWVFYGAGVYGLAVTLPLYFTERQFSIDHPPAVTHPEFYYGFVGLCVAWQIVFLIVGSDPVRYRPIMLAALVEKFSFVIAVPFLLAQGRTPMMFAWAAGMDGVLGVLFVIAWVMTGQERLPQRHRDAEDAQRKPEM